MGLSQRRSSCLFPGLHALGAIALPFRPGRPIHLKEVRATGVPAAAVHAPDQAQALGVDVAALLVLHEGVSDVRAELANQLYVETQRYRLPNYFGGVLGKRRRDAAAEHRKIMDATLRRSEEAVRLLAEHYRKTAEIIEASIEWPSPPGGK